MKWEDAEEYTQSLGQIVVGSWRQVAWAERQGVPAALGLTLREWVEQRIGGYVRMAIPERREAVAELVEEGMTQRDVAGVLGVDVATVNRDLHPRPAADATRTEPDLEAADGAVADPTPPPPTEPPPVPELTPQERHSLTRSHAAEDAELAALQRQHAYLAELNGLRRSIVDLADRIPSDHTRADDGWSLAVRTAADEIARTANSITCLLTQPTTTTIRRIR